MIQPGQEAGVISRSVVRSFVVLFLLGAAVTAYAQAPAALSVEAVSPKVQRVQTSLANVAVLKTDAGLLVVDSGQPSDAAPLVAKLAEIGSPVVYLVNTHYHFDHTGGNAVVGKGAKIVAHEGCQRSMLKSLKPEQKPEEMGVPQETYQTERELRVGKEAVKLLHFGPGHSSGDTVVVFEGEKVIVAGDLFFNGLAPYIDVADGSDTGNWAQTIATLAQRYPGYKVIPGHGPVTDTRGWQRFAEYLTALRQKVAAAVQAGQTREQAVASVKLDEFADIKDMGDFLTKPKNVGWVYDELKRAK
jgi:glyoxylase-like metal-dependent hydrolase (beta-lactamase superfamily II)